MTQQVKVHITKSGNLSLIPRVHRVGETQLPGAVLRLLHVCHGTGETPALIPLCVSLSQSRMQLFQPLPSSSPWSTQGQGQRQTLEGEVLFI